MIQPRNADIILVNGRSWLARAINLFQVEADGLGAASHVAVVCHDGAGIVVVEAEWRVRQMPWADFLYSRRDSGLYIVRDESLSPEAQERIARHVMSYLGEPYSIKRLLAMAWAKLTGSRADLRMKNGGPVCSTIAAKPYWVERGTIFDGEPFWTCTPDNILDHARVAEGFVVHKINGH